MYFEPGAGFLRPENCIQANLELACANGAELHKGEKVVGIIPSSSGEGVKICSESREYFAEKVIITAGPWVSRFMPDRYASLFQAHRQTQYWFDVSKTYERFKDMPIFINVSNFIYGFPPSDGPDGGMKVASETEDPVDPDNVKRMVSSREIEKIYNEKIKNFIPGLGPVCVKALTCLYTNTPDRWFVVDVHPDHPQVFFASPCSGHGAKHSQAIGETVTELAMYDKTTLDIGPFSFERFQV